MKTSSDNRTLVSRWLGMSVAALALAGAAWGGTIGKVVSIGGQASDIALDEARGVLYIANFAGNRIEVMNTSDLTIGQSINVNPLPGSIALSRDGQYLLVAHYGNFKPPASLDAALTLINLRNNTRQTLSLPAAPLAVAFGADGLALVVTTADVSLLDPASGIIQTIDTIPSLGSKTLPVTVPNFPVQITESALGVSGDGLRIYGTTTAFGIVYDVASQTLSTFPTKGAQPPFGPRSVSVNQDGSAFAFAWVIFNAYGGLETEFSNPSGAFNVGGYALDSTAGLLYMQLPDVVNPDLPPTLQVRNVDSLALVDTFQLPENLAGKSLVSSRHVIYSISDSGVLVMPIGDLNQQARLQVSVEDIVFTGAFCDRRTSTQTFTITDPGGGATDFTLTANSPGITITPSSGVTPATVRVSIDPNAFASQNGTFSASIKVGSQSAINLPQPVRVLINTRDPDQRGTVMNVPGKLVDVLADPVRDRFYVIRQDQNQVLVFDGSNYNQVAALATKLGPTQLAMTRDGQYLLIAHENSATVAVYDLDTFQRQAPIYFPYGHIPRSIAVSGGTILAAVHNRVVGGLNSAIDRVDFDNRVGSELPSLGALENKIPSYTVLSGTPNGASIFGMVADGSVFLYDSNSDTFPVYRKDFTALSGAYAASNLNQYVVNNNLMNSSLVTVRKFDTAGGVPSGFAFTGNTTGLLATTAGSFSPGTLQRVDLTQGATMKSTRIAESPIVPFPIVVPITPVPGAPPPPPTTDPNISPFTRSLATLSNGKAIILLTQSGFTVLAQNFDATTTSPHIDNVVNTADRSQPLTAGGLISVLGSNLSDSTISTTQSPLPTVLGGSCVTVNGSVIPLFMVSPQQINAQLTLAAGASGTLIVYTATGVSNPFNFNIQPTAPSVLQVPSGPGSNILVPAVFREQSSLPVNLVDPIHKGDHIIIYASGLGPTDPPVAAGEVSPSNPKAVVLIKPVVTLGGVTCPVTFAGLTPGQIGVYEIRANVPQGVTQGLMVPLTITQGANTGTVFVRVVQ